MPDSSRYISRKKLAVTLGIKASKYEWLVFTNANCMPQSNQWLRLMHATSHHVPKVVLGYSGYERGKGWLHKRGGIRQSVHFHALSGICPGRQPLHGHRA